MGYGRLRYEILRKCKEGDGRAIAFCDTTDEIDHSAYEPISFVMK